MTRDSLQHSLAAHRPGLPHPLEKAADAGFNPYAYEVAECDECGAPLTEREHDPDGSYEGEDEGGSHWSSSNGHCCDCRAALGGDDDE